jgi:hypothetical protein
MLDLVITYLTMLHSSAVNAWFKVLHSHLTGKPWKDHRRKVNQTKSLQRWCKQPRCNKLRLLILKPYMFQAANSPILRSTFDCIYSSGTMHLHCCRLVTGRQQCQCIVPKLHCTKAVYTVKSAPEDGWICCLKHVRLT